MTPTDPPSPQTRAGSMRAFSIMFFAVALLCFMLGWADGVRHDKTYLHIPQTGTFLVVTLVLVVLGVLFLVWAPRGSRRS
jgi:predicted transporter